MHGGSTIEGFVGGETWGRNGVPYQAGRGLIGMGLAPPQKKEMIFHFKWRILVNSERHFCPYRRQKNVELPPEVVIC